MKDVQKRFITGYMREYFIPKISVPVYKEMMNYSIKQNLIVMIDKDYDLLKNVVMSLLLQNKDPIDYKSFSLHQVLDTQFERDDQKKISMKQFTRPNLLIIKEFGDVHNKLYIEVITNIISDRLLYNKPTLFVFTERRPTDLMVKSHIDQFTIVNMRYKKFAKPKVTKGTTQQSTKPNDLY